MDSRELIVKILSDLTREITSLSDEELKKVSDGEYLISLAVKPRARSTRSEDISETDKQNIVSDLGQAETREDGIQVLEDALKNRKELESLAKFLDVSVLKQDKVEYIREKIVEATIGARLRSQAIQGKKT